MRKYRIAAIPGDGIGKEVIAAGLEALDACAAADGGFVFEVTHFDWGSDYYHAKGVMMPADGLAQLKDFDAIYFGAVGAPDVPDHVTLWGLRLAICQPFDQYANVRPARLLKGVPGPLRGALSRRSLRLLGQEGEQRERKEPRAASGSHPTTAALESVFASGAGRPR